MKKNIKFLGVILLAWLVIVGLWHTWLKPLPEGTRVSGETHIVTDSAVTFLADRTFLDSAGERRSEQQIFDTIFQMIDGAQEYVLIDMFLFNDFLGTATNAYRPLSAELTKHLIARKKRHPNIRIIFITDPINTVYGGAVSSHIEALRAAGVHVVVTDLKKLRDSNPGYSALWRTFGQWWSNSAEGGRLPHFMDARRDDITLRSYSNTLNFKANHRKVVVADFLRADGTRGMSTLITSANPHDGSSAHSNSALKIDESLWRDVVTSEKAVATFSGVDSAVLEYVSAQRSNTDKGANSVQNTSTAQLLTEGAIRDALVHDVNALGSGDVLDMTMFYIADRKIVRALKKAAERGVRMRFIFDPNKDAFGREKNGVPNRQVASELRSVGENVQVRWCSTHGEQCHSKMTIIRAADGVQTLMLGSANLTRRNIGDYNLETDVRMTSANNPRYMQDAQAFFDQQWENRDEREYTTDYNMYEDESRARIVLYRFMEATGISSF